MKFPNEDECEQDDDDEDDRDGDADQYCSVVRVCADGLRPGGLTELVSSGVGSDLYKERDMYYCSKYNKYQHYPINQ